MLLYRIKRSKFVIIPTLCVTLFLLTKIVVHWLHFTCENIPLQALVVEEERTCIKSLLKKEVLLFSSIEIQKPSCENILTNLTAGVWIEKRNIRSGQRYEMDSFLQNFRVNVLGYNSKFVRDDMQCGFEVPAESLVCNLVKTYQSAWCNPNGISPCCTSATKGRCVSADMCSFSDSGINLANYVHAELAEWKPSDSRCSYVNFDQPSACKLLAVKQVRSVGFVGNSLMRNMFSVFLQMLTNNYLNGSLPTCVPPSIRKLCAGHMQIMDNNCLSYGLATSSRNLPKPGVCNGQLDLEVYLEMYWLAKFGTELQVLVESNLDIVGSYLLVGIGIHDSYNSKLVIESYLQPAINKLKDHSWPKLIWVHTLKSGIFKPPEYIKYHGDDTDIDQFVTNMNDFCKMENIMTLDFRNLTTGVWSVDGTHFGTAVNRMKIQFFLNLLLSL